MSLMSLFLLPFDAGTMVNMTEELTGFAVGAAAGFANIGRGIGGIMLLIVALYYITSILDGGKFQLKMLIPLLIFILVCNFSWVATPVTQFTKTITSGLVSTCQSSKESIIESFGCSKSANINDLNNSLMESRNDGEQVEKLLGNTDGVSKKKSEDEIDNETVNATDKTGDTEGGRWTRWIRRGVKSAGHSMSYDFQKETSGEVIVEPGSDRQGRKLTLMNQGWLGIISAVVSFVCKIMSSVLSSFGAVMTGLIIAFGPITFGFAVFPGSGRNILSWFLRLCQFALWAPIVALIDAFSVKIFSVMASASMDSGSLAMAISVAVCNLVALTSVPTIASMIIEGASGAVSLSQGLQTIGGALTAGGSAAAAIGGGAAKAGELAIGTDKTQALRDAVAGAKQGGVAGALRDIRYSSGIKDLAKSWQAAGRKSRQSNFGNYTH